MTTCLVRESGGIGDIICLGAAALGIKKEQPKEGVIAFVPQEFTPVAGHLEGIDETVSLGSVSQLQEVRRNRDEPIDIKKHKYLSVLGEYPKATIVDCYCPGFLYENSCKGILRYNRPQLFAMAAGVKNVKNVYQRWIFREVDLKEADKYLESLKIPTARGLIAVQLRATCAARSFPKEKCSLLLERLAKLGHVLIFDCVGLQFEVPVGCTPVINFPISIIAALLTRCSMVVTVDSFLWHLAAAVNIPAVGIFGPTDGKVSAQTYLRCAIVSGEGRDCILPCNYNASKRWSKSCRKTGCERMLSISVDKVFEEARKTLNRGTR